MTRPTLALAAALAAAAFAAIPDDASGCAAVPRKDQSVEASDEAALVVWDAKNKTEHFVRRASFRSTGYDFGFLVPTPTPPALDVAGDDLFTELNALTSPKVEYHEQVKEVQKDFLPGCGSLRLSRGDVSAPPAAELRPGKVEVLDERRIGDYDAAVLTFRKGEKESPDRGPQELEKWLIEHGFVAPPALKPWLAKYVADGWCVTAFKVARPGQEKGAKAGGPPGGPQEVRLKPIRMSFKTDRPFYPYREPQAEQPPQSRESRTLRVFFAGPGRFAGKLGDGAKPWPAETTWAGPVDASRWASLFQKASLTGAALKDAKPAVEAPNAEGLWLTEFEDRSSPRPAADEVYFEPSADASPVARPPVVVTSTRIVSVAPWWHAAVFFGVPAAVVLGGLAAWRLLRRRA